MEASKTINKGGGSSGGGEVRRLHIIYFLSRMGRIEHPHLIRVHHLNRNGVYLRDVKRWMTDLRGKDMAESFAWSYKRRYKNGYVWQDLLDDDLISPISDNEYVLKGSEIIPTNSYETETDDKQVSMSKDDENVQVEKRNEEKQMQESANPTKAPPADEIYRESPIFSSDGSTVSDDLIRKQEQDENKQEIDNLEALSSSSFYSNMLEGKRNKKNKNEFNDSSSSSSSSISPQLQYVKSKSSSSGASKMLRSLMTCGAVNTNDAALVPIHTASSSSNKVETGSTGALATQRNPRRFQGANDSKKQQQSGYGNPKGVSAAYKPVGAPTCSQCGKSFKPEKLHTHMKACKGMKSSAKPVPASVRKTPSMNTMNQLIAIS